MSKTYAWTSPPSWPKAPTGWAPPPGWSPPPAWPAPPVGWQWWQPTKSTPLQTAAKGTAGVIAGIVAVCAIAWFAIVAYIGIGLMLNPNF